MAPITGIRNSGSLARKVTCRLESTNTSAGSMMALGWLPTNITGPSASSGRRRTVIR